MGLWLGPEALCLRSRTKLQENCSCGCHGTCPLGQPGPAEKASHVASPSKARSPFPAKQLCQLWPATSTPPSLDFSWTQRHLLCQVVWGKCVHVPGQREMLHRRVVSFLSHVASCSLGTSVWERHRGKDGTSEKWHGSLLPRGDHSGTRDKPRQSSHLRVEQPWASCFSLFSLRFLTCRWGQGQYHQGWL